VTHESGKECADSDSINVYSDDGAVWFHFGKENTDTENCVCFGMEVDDAMRFASAIAHCALNQKMQNEINKRAADIAVSHMGVPTDIRPEDIIGDQKP
jgi:hypothetical protein